MYVKYIIIGLSFLFFIFLISFFPFFFGGGEGDSQAIFYFN